MTEEKRKFLGMDRDRLILIWALACIVNFVLTVICLIVVGLTLVIRADVREGITATRTEFQTEMVATETEFKAETAALREDVVELKVGIARVEGKIYAHKDRFAAIADRVGALEIRVAALGDKVDALDDSVASIENGLLDVESVTKRIDELESERDSIKTALGRLLAETE